MNYLPSYSHPHPKVQHPGRIFNPFLPFGLILRLGFGLEAIEYSQCAVKRCSPRNEARNSPPSRKQLSLRELAFFRNRPIKEFCENPEKMSCRMLTQWRKVV
jgi:hypothetical protein